MIGMVIWVLWANTALEMNTITVVEKNLPQAFDGYRIAHVSDLHSAEMGKDNEKLIAMLKNASPDIVCMTGDIMDARATDPQIVLSFVQQAAKIAPCYYITGNHEVRLSEELYRQLMNGLESAGVTILNDEEVLLYRGDDVISLYGHAWGSVNAFNNLSSWAGYRILLSHPPEDFAAYASAGFDLVLSGHAHGGQFRLPFVGGLYAPGQGLFPKYDAGLYSEGNTDMIVSRGIGNSSFPLRFNNRPELIIIVLKNA